MTTTATIVRTVGGTRESVGARRRTFTPLVACRTVSTPVGPFVVAIDERGELTTGWQRPGWPPPCSEVPAGSAVADRLDRSNLLERVARYFAGDAISFDDLPVHEGTGFQRACWQACREIPRGETISYAELARRSGSDGAARAAGQCMRRNPTPILVPCHRVVGADGGLHGFGGATDPTGRELGMKGWLLELERKRG